MTSFAPAPLDLCAIGNVCIDLIATVPDEFLERHHIAKSITTLIDGRQLAAIEVELPEMLRLPGGVGGNVSHVVAALGGRAGFQGKCGQDSSGALFAADLKAHNIAAHLPIVSDPSLNSSQIVCLGSLDGDRTFASYDGAAKTLVPEDLDREMISNSKALYLDGFCLMAPGALATYLLAIDINRAAGGLAFFNPCDPYVITSYPDCVKTLLAKVDGVICNLTEARMLFGDGELRVIAERMAQSYKAGAVTDGAHGAWVFRDTELAFIPPANISALPRIDSNGAGDHFAAGFIYGMLSGLPLEAAGRLGCACSLDCLSHAGARPLGSLRHLVLALNKI